MVLEPSTPHHDSSSKGKMVAHLCDLGVASESSTEPQLSSVMNKGTPIPRMHIPNMAFSNLYLKLLYLILTHIPLHIDIYFPGSPLILLLICPNHNNSSRPSSSATTSFPDTRQVELPSSKLPRRAFSLSVL